MIDKHIIEKISNLLKQKNYKVATAESCTGGLIANILTNISGSSEYFDRGIVSYSNEAKMDLLGVSEEILKEYGAVSKQVAVAMADGVRTKSKVDIGIATTGVAGPTGGTIDKPVGLVYVSISTKNDTIVKKFNFSWDRLQNKEETCKAALNMLLDVLTS